MYRLIEVDAYSDKNILVVGGGDSAVEAAIGLASQKGNLSELAFALDFGFSLPGFLLQLHGHFLDLTGKGKRH